MNFLTKNFANTAAVSMLTLMFLLMLGSSWNDSATFDEIAHIGAGYTYLKYQDMRLNPEHPPLLKDLAALPLQFLNLISDIPSQPFWTLENVNDRQWAAGNYLLYETGNDPDRILFWSRLPTMILAIIFGWILYAWITARYGKKVGLLTLFFFVTSPTFLAHSRFVTTDLGAAYGFFLGIIFFIKFLETRSWRSTIWLGIVLGVIMLMKFSLVLLLPIYLVLFLVWIWIYYRSPSHQSFQSLENFMASASEHSTQDQNLADEISRRGRAKFSERGEENFRVKEISDARFWPCLKLLGKLVMACFIAFFVIYIVYTFQIWNYPQDQHVKDVKYILSGYKVELLPKIDLALVENKLARPLGHYFFGFLMVARRTAGGNTAYFMGEVSSKGWWSYFPTLALTKEQLSFYILAAIALFWTLKQITSAWRQSRQLGGRAAKLTQWTRENFFVFASVFFLGFYWISSILNPLNIGVRHVLPTFPFMYFLTARGIVRWWKNGVFKKSSESFFALIKNFYENYLRPAPKYLVTAILMVLMLLDVFLSFPHYLSYYNILGGGLKNGYRVATDSNYDWGQDLKRLKFWVEENKIDKIYLDYFGGGSPKSYLGEKFVPWWSAIGVPPLAPTETSAQPVYFAVSLNSLTGSQARPVGDIKIKPEDSYSWLLDREPVARAGASILIFKF